jgi:hypothetical protein
VARTAETSFWGNPTYKPADKDVVRFVEAIRELTEKNSKQRKLKVATSAMHAITAFIAHDCGPREAIAILDKLRAELLR